MASDLEIKNEIISIVSSISKKLKEIANELDRNGALSEAGEQILTVVRSEIKRLFNLYDYLGNSSRLSLNLDFEGSLIPFNNFKIFLMHVSNQIRSETGKGLFN